MKKTTDNLPVGFGMSLAMNTTAMKAFAAMSETEQKHIVDRAAAVRSREEMDAIINALASPDAKM